MTYPLSELIERVIGPLIFAVAVSLLAVSITAVTDLLKTAEDLEDDSAVYAYGSSGTVQDIEFDASSVAALLISQPDIPVTVKYGNTTTTYTFLESGQYLEKVVTVTNGVETESSYLNSSISELNVWQPYYLEFVGQDISYDTTGAISGVVFTFK